MENFEITYVNETVPVQIMRTGGQTIYVAKLKKGKPLFLCRALDARREYFWTSIPEGRLAEATEIGIRIDFYLKQKESECAITTGLK